MSQERSSITFPGEWLHPQAAFGATLWKSFFFLFQTAGVQINVRFSRQIKPSGVRKFYFSVISCVRFLLCTLEMLLKLAAPESSSLRLIRLDLFRRSTCHDGHPLSPVSLHPARKALTALISHRFDAIRLLRNLVRSFPLTFHPTVTVRAADRTDCLALLLIHCLNHQNSFSVLCVENHAADWCVNTGRSPGSPQLQWILTEASCSTSYERRQV